MIPEKLGKYEIRGTLGRGAMGQVYDGWDPLIHRQVAIKTVRLADAGDEEAAEGLARFRREAQAAGRLSHPNIVGVYDFGETDEVAYIVMEFVSGGSLRDVLDRREPLTAAWVCGVMGQVLAGLAYSHARGVVHRDVKPANVMLDGDGAAKLADFGIARIENSNATSVGAIMGTPAYMAPEQFLGEAADPRSDLYAAGAMLFHLLTGTRPYEGNPSAIMHKVLNATAPPKPSQRFPGLPQALDPVLERAMARRKEDRFGDAAAFSTALNAALYGQAAEADEERTVVIRAPALPGASAKPPTARQASSARTRPVWAFAIGTVLVAAGAGAWVSTRPASPPMPSPSAPQPDPPKPIRPLPAPRAAERVEAVNKAIAAIPCSLVRASVADDVVGITGVVGGGNAAASLSQAASGAASRVAVVPSFYCAALAALHPASGSALASIGVQVAHIAKSKEVHLHPSISGLDFPAYLRVDYLNADGTMFHIYPHARSSNSVDVEDPAEILPKGVTLRLGTSDHQPLAIFPPFSGDLILAVASERELLPGRRDNAEPEADYFQALKQAILQAQAGGQKLAAGAIPLQSIALP